MRVSCWQARGAVAALVLAALVACSARQPRETGAAAHKGDALPKLTNGDLPPLQETANGIKYDPSGMLHPEFDGAVSDAWIHLPDSFCRDGAMRPIVVDVDRTVVSGNFLYGVEVREVARVELTRFNEKYGVVFLTANFAYDRVLAFFKKHGYPIDAPLLARPRNYWHPHYTEWCRQGTHYDVCESNYKADRIQFMRGVCKRDPKRMVGLGDKFSDYLAYRQCGLCPIIVSAGDVYAVNKAELEAGCQLDRKGEYAWIGEGKEHAERCAVVPDRFIMPWSDVESALTRYMSGKVDCGKW